MDFDQLMKAMSTPEKIIIFMDTSADVKLAKLHLNDQAPIESFERLQKIVNMFISNKEFACNGPTANKPSSDALKSIPKVEFGIMLELGGSPSVLTGGDFGDAKTTIERLAELRVQEDAVLVSTGDQPSTHDFNIGEALRNLTQNIYIHGAEQNVDATSQGEFPSPFLTRFIMFMTRSRSAIKFEVGEDLKRILQNPYFYVDVLYLHEEPSDANLVHQNYVNLMKLNELQNGRGYILESGPDVTDWHNASTFLLYHPMVRKPCAELEPRKRNKATAVLGTGVQSSIGDDGDGGTPQAQDTDLIQI